MIISEILILAFLLMGILIISITGCKSKNEEKAVEKNYYCEEGILKGNNCEIAMTEDAIQVCDDGYQMIEGKCIKNEIIDAKKATTCEEGFTLNNNKCISNKAYDKIETRNCILPPDLDKGPINVYENGHIIPSSNQAYEKDGICYITVWKNYNQTLDVYYDKETSQTDFILTTTCPTDTEEINGKCYKITNIQDGYTCEKGELNGEIPVLKVKDNKCERINLTKALEK